MSTELAKVKKELFGGAPRIITIVEHNRGFSVHEGERYCCWLCWDEMLAQIAAMTMPLERIAQIGAIYPMNTPEELAEIEERRAARYAEIRREEESTIQGENAP